MRAAAAWFRKAADQGDAAAQFNLGVLLVWSRRPSDIEQAAMWYRKAADQDHAARKSNLGVLYHNGQGVPQTTLRRPFGIARPRTRESPPPSSTSACCTKTVRVFRRAIRKRRCGIARRPTRECRRAVQPGDVVYAWQRCPTERCGGRGVVYQGRRAG